MLKLNSVSRFYGAYSETRTRCANARLLYTSKVVYEGKDGKDANLEDVKEKAEVESKQTEIKAKLKDLLLTMSKKSDFSEPVEKVKIPKPRVKAQKEAYEWKKKHLEAIENAKKNELGNRLSKAAKNVAETLGGDTEKTEKELLDLYLSSIPKKNEAANTDQQEKGTLNENEVPKPNIKNLISSMKIDKEIPKEHSRAYQVQVLKTTGSTRNAPFPQKFSGTRITSAERVDVFSGTPLGIFTLEDGEKKPLTNTIVWDYLYQRDLRLSVTHPPANIFEQLILWTEQGKIWKFPIDNEQDWIDEENVHFTEHVFLEKWLEPWCPKSGPIRHFMELVCTGLSMNPYLSVSEKKAHIIFYEHYFRGRNSLLVDLGMDPITDRSNSEQQQQ